MPPASFKQGLVAEMANLRAFAISLSGSASVADDLVQEAMLRAWANFDKFEPGTSMRAWLFTILRNFYFSSRRKGAREVQDSDGFYAQRVGRSRRPGKPPRPARFSQGAGAPSSRAARGAYLGRRKRPVLRRGRRRLRG